MHPNKFEEGKAIELPKPLSSPKRFPISFSKWWQFENGVVYFASLFGIFAALRGNNEADPLLYSYFIYHNPTISDWAITTTKQLDLHFKYHDIYLWNIQKAFHYSTFRFSSCFFTRSNTYLKNIRRVVNNQTSVHFWAHSKKFTPIFTTNKAVCLLGFDVDFLHDFPHARNVCFLWPRPGGVRKHDWSA